MLAFPWPQERSNPLGFWDGEIFFPPNFHIFFKKIFLRPCFKQICYVEGTDEVLNSMHPLEALGPTTSCF